MDTNAWNMVFGIIGTIGTILGIVGLVLAIRSVKKKEPVYSIKSNNLISGSTAMLENLNISYKEHKVENLTVSKILFYNRGAETIHRQDTETINPLKIVPVSCKILDGTVLEVNNVSNNISVHYMKDNQSIVIDFDYLDKNQGAVIQVVHTGFSSHNLNLYGDIKGVQELVCIAPDRFRKGRNWQSLPARLKIDLGIIGGSFMLFSIFVLYIVLDIVEFFSFFGFFAVTLVVVLVLIGLITFFRREFKPGNMPNGLDKFDE